MKATWRPSVPHRLGRVPLRHLLRAKYPIVTNTAHDDKSAARALFPRGFFLAVF